MKCMEAFSSWTILDGIMHTYYRLLENIYEISRILFYCVILLTVLPTEFESGKLLNHVFSFTNFMPYFK